MELTYEQKREAETLARVTKRDEFRALAQRVATHLGASVLPYSKPENEFMAQYDGNVNLMKDGRTFSLSIYLNNLNDKFATRIEVSGCYTSYTDASGCKHYVTPRDVATYEERQAENPSPSITVSAKRSAEAIARDIENRFLPAFVRMHTRCVEYAAQHTAYNASVKDRAESFAKEFGRASHQIKLDNGSATVWTKAAAMRVQTDGVRFEAFYATDAQARQILAILAAGTKAE